MKNFQLLTICALIFLPTPVEGTIFLNLVRFLLNSLFWSERRDKRDCDSLILATGQDITYDAEGCYCFGIDELGVIVGCRDLKDTICLSPSDTTFCSVSNSYSASSTERSTFSFSTSPLKIERESVSATFNVPDYNSSFFFGFLHGDGSPSSKKYTSCSISASSYLFSKDEYNSIKCASCAICDTGIDFKYDCSNANGTFAFSDITNTTTLIPGPKVDSCFPVADFIPTI